MTSFSNAAFSFCLSTCQCQSYLLRFFSCESTSFCSWFGGSKQKAFTPTQRLLLCTKKSSCSFEHISGGGLGLPWSCLVVSCHASRFANHQPVKLESKRWWFKPTKLGNWAPQPVPSPFIFQVKTPFGRYRTWKRPTSGTPSLNLDLFFCFGPKFPTSPFVNPLNSADPLCGDDPSPSTIGFLDIFQDQG